MKALVISDVHSNYYGLQAIWEQEQDSDIIYCAGDLVDYGPFPQDVIRWVKEHDVICVKGNHDAEVVAHYHSGRLIEDIPEAERTWVHHNANLLAEEDIQFLEGLPEHITFILDDINYCMKHTFRNGSYETIENRIQFDQFWKEYVLESLATKKQKRVIFGHTHNQAIHYLKDDELWLNPGSVSYRPTRQQEDFSQDAHYMTIVDGQINIKNVHYDLTPLYNAIKNEKLSESQLKVAHRFFNKNSFV